MIKKITSEMIDDVLFSGRTFIILFHSKNIANMEDVFAVFDRFYDQFQGKIDIYECSMDNENGKLAQYFSMPTLPGMVMMKNNKPYGNISGPTPVIKYEEIIKKGILAIMEDEQKDEEVKGLQSSIDVFSAPPKSTYQTIK